MVPALLSGYTEAYYQRERFGDSLVSATKALRI